MPSLLVIDDDSSVLLLMRKTFQQPDITLYTATTSHEGLTLIEEHRPDVIVLDIMLPDLSGLETFQQLRKRDAKIPVIFITSSQDSSTAIEAMKLGAYDYLSKPLDVRQLRDLVNRAFEISRLMNTPVEVAETESSVEGLGDAMVGKAPPMLEVYKKIGRVAPQDITVLIQGETGTGKELVARAIYQHSARSSGPFLAVNCAAIPDTLLESELFGHEKGAFTGADQVRIGKFEQCSGGTLFLDEIGDMTALTQSKVLRVLQEHNFQRVGGNETLKADVRILAATHHNLEKRVAEGLFREDLYYRLKDYKIELPPLRNRVSDLPLMVNHFLKRFSKRFNKEVTRVSEAALNRLRGYHWPGNVRELESALKQALVRATGPELIPEFFVDLQERPVDPEHQSDLATSGDLDWERFVNQRLQENSKDLYAESLRCMELGVITSVLEHTQGNQLQAAKILGITRTSLRNKIRQLGISIDKIIRADEDADDKE